MKNTKKILASITICTSLIALPISVIAADAAEESAQEESNISLPTNSTPSKVNLIIKLQNEENDRMLGGAIVYIDKVQYKITDPPSPSGTIIKDVVAAEHEIIVERKGYETYDAVVAVQSNLENQKLVIELTPASGTPDVTEGVLKEYLESYNSGSYYYPQNQVLNPYDNNQYNQYSGLNNSSSNVLINDSSSLSGLFNTDSKIYSQSTGLSTVPVQLTINTSAYSSVISQQTQIILVDSQSRYVNLSDLYQSSQITNSSQLQRYGCLEPGRQYTIIIKNSNNNLLNYTTNFISGSNGQITQISASIADYYTYAGGQTGVNPVYIQNSVLTNTQLASVCSSQNSTFGTNNFSNNSTLNNAQNIFSSQTLDSSSLDNYEIKVSVTGDGNYYLVNKNNSLENRKMFFVDSGTGKKGIVFIPDSTATSIDPSSSGKWYIGLYTRDDKGEVDIDTPLTRVEFSPKKYAEHLNSQVVSNFLSTAKDEPTSVE